MHLYFLPGPRDSSMFLSLCIFIPEKKGSAVSQHKHPIILGPWAALHHLYTLCHSCGSSDYWMTDIPWLTYYNHTSWFILKVLCYPFFLIYTLVYFRSLEFLILFPLKIKFFTETFNRMLIIDELDKRSVQKCALKLTHCITTLNRQSIGLDLSH